MEHEKHLYGSLATLLFLPPSNCRPILCRLACMFALVVVVVRQGLAGDFLEFMRHDTRMLAQPAVPTGSLLAPARHCLTAVESTTPTLAAYPRRMLPQNY